MEINKKLLAGILTAVVFLSTGIVLYIQDAGTRTGCRAGWEPFTSGELEGYYKCTTASAVRTELCFDVFDSANTPNYWCQRGKLVDEPAPSVSLDIKISANGKNWLCPTDEGKVTSYTKCISDKGTDGYLGELV